MTSSQTELSYTSGAAELPLLGDTIGADLSRSVARFGDREALVDVPSGRRWTYAELGRAVDEVALGLLAKGVGKGDRVGIWAPNCAEWVLSSTPPPASARSWSTSTRPTGCTS